MDSYEAVLSRMKDKYEELTGRSVPPLSDIDVRMKVLAGEIFNNEMNLEFIKRQMFPATATGEFLELHAEDRGIHRKQATKATGELCFTIPEAVSYNISIPEGTVAATSGDGAVRFVTTEGGILPAGNTIVSVDAEAVEVGSAGNVDSWNINNLVTSVIGIAAVTNPSAFTGGIDRETDDELRKRVLDSFITISNGTNCEFYRKLAVSVDGVKSAGVVPRARGTGTVNVYLRAQSGIVTTALRNKVAALLNAEREINVNVQVYGASTVSTTFGANIKPKNGYDFTTVANNVRSSVMAYIDSLEIGEDVVESRLGKAIIDAEGVYDYEWITNYPTSLYVPTDSVAVYSSIRLEAMT